MNIICIKKCETIHKQPYRLGEYYTYDYDDYLDGLDIKYYAIYVGSYNGNNQVMGYANGRFIEENFTSVYNYIKEMKYVDQMFDFYMDFALKLDNDNKDYINAKSFMS